MSKGISRGRNVHSQEKYPFPGVLVWSANLVDSRPILHHDPVERIVAECTKFIALVTVTKKIVWRLNKQKLVAVYTVKNFRIG